MGSDSKTQSPFENLHFEDPVNVHAQIKAYDNDDSLEKVNLAFSTYRTDEGEPWVLPVVHSVEKQMAADVTLNHESLPEAGQLDFRLAGIRLLLGKDNVAVIQNRVDAVQSVGSSGALRIGLEFLRLHLNFNTIYISRPAQGNIRSIAKALNYKIMDYHYWNAERCCVEFAGMLEDLKAAPDFSVIFLNMCAHNPTGQDLNMDEWKSLADALKEKKVFVFFDCGHQGLSSGDLDVDAAPLRLFVKERFELFAVQSFTKNFGIYNERPAQLIFVVNQSEDLVRISSQLSTLVRNLWRSPPQHGSRIVATVLNNPALSMEWKENVRVMAERLQSAKQLLYFKLKAIGTPGNWDHIIRQTGMFCYTGLEPFQCDFLRQQYHIYVMRNGRINVCGITSTNVDNVVSAIHDAVEARHVP